MSPSSFSPSPLLPFPLLPFFPTSPLLPSSLPPSLSYFPQKLSGILPISSLVYSRLSSPSLYTPKHFSVFFIRHAEKPPGAYKHPTRFNHLSEKGLERANNYYPRLFCDPDEQTNSSSYSSSNSSAPSSSPSSSSSSSPPSTDSTDSTEVSVTSTNSKGEEEETEVLLTIPPFCQFSTNPSTLLVARDAEPPHYTMREIETLEPLALHLGTDIKRVTIDDEPELLEQVIGVGRSIGVPRAAGAESTAPIAAVISWEHRNVRKLGKFFGCSPNGKNRMKPLCPNVMENWPDEDFGSVVQFIYTYTDGNRKKTKLTETATYDIEFLDQTLADLLD